MATRDSMDELIKDTNQYIAEAETQLDITNRNGFEVDSSYVQAQQKLSEAEGDIEKMMVSANHQQKEQLHRLHLRVSQSLNDMILDHVDMDELQ